MEVQKGKGGIYPLAILFVMMMLLIYPYCCAGAAVVVESNTTTVRYNNGRIEESLIEYDLELESLMNPYVSRILAGGQTVTGATGNRNRPACVPMPCTDTKCPYNRGHQCWLHIAASYGKVKMLSPIDRNNPACQNRNKYNRECLNEPWSMSMYTCYLFFNRYFVFVFGLKCLLLVCITDLSACAFFFFNDKMAGLMCYN